jgi:hypothetical protein
MTKNLITMLAVACLTSSAFAGILTTTAGDKSIEGVQVAKDGSVSIENQSIPVSIVGAGLRSKKVAIMTVKVYVAELLSSDASKFVRTEADALASLNDSRTTVVRMNFLRGVDAASVQGAFAEGFKANGIDTTETSVAAFLKAISDSGDAVAGKALTFVVQKNADKTETVYYEDSNDKMTKVSGTEGFAKKVMSLWLGSTTDAGVQKMKEQIIKGQ